MDTRLITTGDPLWKEALAQTPHDFYHLPGYLDLCADQEAGQPCALWAAEGDDRLLLPLLLRPIESAGTKHGELVDATSPYGYPLPLVWNRTQPHPAVGQLETFLEHALESLHATLLAENVVSVFVRFHPLLPIPLEPFRRQGTLVHHGETVFLDLTLSDEDQWHQMRPAYRNRISRAERNGLVAEIDQEWDSFEDFFDIYTDTMRRVNASPFYFFPRQYFLELRDALAGALHLALVRVKGEIACAGLFSEVCGMVQLHLTGNRPDFSEHHAPKYMIDFVRRWAKTRGNHALHLGGGLGAQNDSLLYFKAGFSELRGNFYTWRTIVHREAYRELVGQWQRQAAAEADEPDGFFPAYRKPLPQKMETAREPLVVTEPVGQSQP